MIKVKSSTQGEAIERDALRRRVRQIYAWFNREEWSKCYSLIDPLLIQKGKVELSSYADRLQVFKQAYGKINPWHVRVNLHLKSSASQQDRRPFAFVYTVWQDDAHTFHMFKERWVKHQGRWYTRVLGPVPNRA